MLNLAPPSPAASARKLIRLPYRAPAYYQRDRGPPSSSRRERDPSTTLDQPGLAR